MTCKDCVHYEACKEWCSGIDEYIDPEGKENQEPCKHFKDKTRFVELPCENWLEIVFGDKDVFYGIEEETVSEINVYNEERLTWYDGWRTVVIKGFDENVNYEEKLKEMKE